MSRLGVVPPPGSLVLAPAAVPVVRRALAYLQADGDVDLELLGEVRGLVEIAYRAGSAGRTSEPVAAAVGGRSAEMVGARLAANALGVSTEYFTRQCRDGKIPGARRVGRVWGVDSVVVQELVRRREQERDAG